MRPDAMIRDPSTAQVWWDAQLMTYCGILNGQRVGTHSGDILTVGDLQTRLGVTLHADTSAALGEQFAAAPYVAPNRHITKLAYRGRFLQSERTAFEMAAIHDYSEAMDSPRNLRAADVRAWQADFAAAKDYIDLDDPRTRTPTQALEAGRLIGEGRALQILDAPIEAHERPAA